MPALRCRLLGLFNPVPERELHRLSVSVRQRHDRSVSRLFRLVEYEAASNNG